MKQGTNTEYELSLKLIKAWNERRAANEKKALERFYKLKEFFKSQKTKNHETGHTN